MTPDVDEIDDFFLLADSINHDEIASDMAITRRRKFTGKGMISIHGRQRFPLLQAIDDKFEIGDRTL